jgi:hypothetical protein
LGHEGVGQRERQPLPIRQAADVVVEGLLQSPNVERLLPGNCQADRQSGMAVVMLGASQPDHLGGDRIDRV